MTMYREITVARERRDARVPVSSEQLTCLLINL